MHELPITQSILDLVVDHARRAGATRVTDVHLILIRRAILCAVARSGNQAIGSGDESIGRTSG